MRLRAACLVLILVGIAPPVAGQERGQAATASGTDGSGSGGNVGNPAKREEFLRRARNIDERGRGFEHYMIGVFYLQGKEIEQDTAEAVRWFRKGAIMGDHASQRCMVHAYEAGEGLPRDPVEAFAWSIVSGDVDGEDHRNLERSLTPEQRGRAKRRSDELRVAVAEGEAIARRRFRETQREIAEDDLKTNMPLAKQGDASAQRRIGIIYSRGEGGVVPVDRVEACAWWTLAAAGGDKDAEGYLRETRQELGAAELERVTDRAEALRSEIAARRPAK